MTKATIKITTLIKNNLTKIIPELEGEEIDVHVPFVDIGANSLDRVKLVTLTLETLGLEVSRVKFVAAQTINELVGLIILYSFFKQPRVSH